MGSWDRVFFLWLMTPEKKKARTLPIPPESARPTVRSFVPGKKYKFTFRLYTIFFLGTFFSSSISVNIPILLSPFIFLLVVGLVGGHGKFAFYVGACFAP